MPGRPSLRWKTGSGIVYPQASGIGPNDRAAPGTVGFRGNEASLITLNAGDPLGALGSIASWDGGILQVTTANSTISGYKLPGIYTTAGDLTVNGCVIDRNGSNDVIYGISVLNATDLLTVTDTTVRDSAPNENGALGIGADSGRVHAERCDISGFEDCVGGGGQMYVRQCYLHNVDGQGADPHNDCIQMYPGLGSGGLHEKNYIICSAYNSDPNSPTSSAGQSSACGINCSGAFTVNDNYIRFGAVAFLIENVSGAVVTNNDWGQMDVGTFEAQRTAGTITTWTNNRDYLGNPISQP